MYQKSSFCSSDGCVEALVWAEGVLVRDTKFAAREEESPVLAFQPGAWQRFLHRIKGGAVLSALTYEPGDVVIWVGQLNGIYFMSRAGDPTTLEFDQTEWKDFVKGIHAGEFDLSDELALAV